MKQLVLPLILFSFICIAGFVITVQAGESEKWLLMSRYGECAAIDTLKRKVPDIERVNDPESFIKFMEAKGKEVIKNEPTELQGKAVEVNVPGEGLSLMFVLESICNGFIGTGK